MLDYTVIFVLLIIIICILAYIIHGRITGGAFTGGSAGASSDTSHDIDQKMDEIAHTLRIGDVPVAENFVSAVGITHAGQRLISDVKYKGGGVFGSVYKLHARSGKNKEERNNEGNDNPYMNVQEVKSSANNNANWTQYRSWESLHKHKNALAKYSQDIHDVLKNPNLDWSKVQAEIMPKLNENVEYIGLINLEEDGKTLYVSDIFRSHQQKNTGDSSSVFASVSQSLVEKTMDIPALFIFHTHPADVRACQMPSSHDISAAIHFGSANHYAANVVISRFGIILYGINDNMKEIFYSDHDEDHAELVRLNYTLDVIMAHESIRSWKPHTLQDYVDFYDQYKLFLYIYPSSEFVASRKEIEYDLHYPLDYCVIESHYKYLKRFLDENKKLKSKFSN